MATIRVLENPHICPNSYLHRSTLAMKLHDAIRDEVVNVQED